MFIQFQRKIKIHPVRDMHANCASVLLSLFHLIHPYATQDSGLTTYLPVDIAAPHGSETGKIQVHIPSHGEHQIADPVELFQHVKASWDTVVESNQAGLMDAKHGNVLPAGLSHQEAWHHFQAGRAGVVDSARFLITFSMVPSVQTGGTPLHIAAALGSVKRVQYLIDEGENVDAQKEDGTTPLHAAATMGHADVVKILLEERALKEVTGNNGATPLMMASAMGHVDVVSALLDGGADPDTAHAYGKSTALHFAAEVGREAVVRELCKRGANVEVEKVTGGGPLHSAADANQTDIVRILVEECGAKVNKLLMKDTTPLYLAAQRGFTELVLELIRLGADVNFVMPRGQHSGHLIPMSQDDQNVPYYPMKNTEIGNGATALHAAVENGHLDTARALLKKGTIQSNSMEGATPLIIALQYRHPDIALVLLEESYSDPKVNAKVPSDGSSALFVASGFGYDKVVRRLLDRGANPNISNRRGATALSHAIVQGHQGIVSMLLAAGAKPVENGGGNGVEGTASSLHMAVESRNLQLVKQILNTVSSSARDQMINAKANDDQTPLHLAIKGPLAIVQVLLDKGADSNAVVKSTGATPLHMAALHGRVNAALLLLKNGAKLEPRGSKKLYGATPLYLATQNGHLQMVEELLDAGADVNCRLRDMAITPLFVASERGHKAIVSLLLERNATPHARNWNGLTPLGIAAMSDHAGIVDELLAAGAEVNSKDNEGTSVLLNTIIPNDSSEPRSSIRVAKKLILAGGDPNLHNHDGLFPLLALANRDPEKSGVTAKWVRLLLENGAHINKKMAGQTALVAATLKGATDVVKIFLEFGAFLDIPVPGSSLSEKDRILLPLGMSIKSKNVELAKLLLENRARQCYEHGDGKVPVLSGCMDIAIGTRHSDMIQLIGLYNSGGGDGGEHRDRVNDEF